MVLAKLMLEEGGEFWSWDAPSAGPVRIGGPMDLR